MEQHRNGSRFSASLKEWVRPYYLKLLYFRWASENRPSYFEDCWRVPNSSIGEHGPWPTPVDSQPDLLFLPMTDWHTRIQRTQHLARTFAEAGHRCLYLNPHLGREFPLPYAMSAGARVGEVAPRVSELHLHLPSEPVYHHRMLRPSETGRIVAGISEAIAAHGRRRTIQIVSFPIWMDAAIELRKRFGFPIVYDCHDLLTGFKLVEPEIAESELRYLEQSDLVVFSSRYLSDRILESSPSLKSRSCVVRNGVKVADFPKVEDLTTHSPSEPPVIGYVGALEFWFDVEAIRHAAAARPHWRFLLVGRIESPHIEELRRLPNVELAGEVPYTGLRDFYQRMDVALIPFRDLPLTQAANPIKIYEYFAYGLPVVSRPLAETELFGDLVYLANTSQDFLPWMEAALAENDSTLRLRRRQVAERESWQSRCDAMATAFNALRAEQS